MKLASVAETSDELFDQTIAINLKGAFNGMREAARRLHEGGRIVSFSSSVVGLYQPTYAAYAATKAGIQAMSHILAKELGSKKITVNVIAPGPVATDLFLKGKTDDEIKPIVGRTPARPAWRARRYRPRHLVPGRSGRRLDQRPGSARQWRHHLRSLTMGQIILVTGASSGFGRMIATDLATAGHTAYASMRGDGEEERQDRGRHRPRSPGTRASICARSSSTCRTMPRSGAAVGDIMREHGRIDVVVHNAGHMVYGPARGVHARAACRALRHQRSRHPTRQPCRPAAYARSEGRPAGMDVQHERDGRHPTAAWSLLRCKGRHGPDRRLLRARVGAARNRDRHRRAWRVH